MVIIESKRHFITFFLVIAFHCNRYSETTFRELFQGDCKKKHILYDGAKIILFLQFIRNGIFMCFPLALLFLLASFHIFKSRLH